MLGRQKVLLGLIALFKKNNKKLTKTILDKFLFVLEKESNISTLVKFYHFFPYYYGPFSNNYYLDLAQLESAGYFDKKFGLNAEALKVVEKLTLKEQQILEQFFEKFSNKNVVQYVYQNYPQYTVKSLLKNTAVDNSLPAIFSVGYEGKDIDLFLDCLIQNGIDLVVDVRANAFSMNFCFTKQKLSNYLKKSGIEYLHVPELGIKGEHRKQLETDSDYKKLFEFYAEKVLPMNGEKIKQLIEFGKSRRISLLCFEKDKNFCHRGILSNHLQKNGQLVTHL